MKKLYFVLYTLFPVLVLSQTILNQQESTTRTVQDPNAVILAQGFHAVSSVSNPFIAKIGESTETPNNPTNSQAGENNPNGTSTPFGINFHDTQGNIEVNGGGQLQYTLPIALPPGVKSVAPQINLVYTSGGGNGIAGYGWNISGITAISRTGKTIEKDGEIKGIQLDYSDYYSFNGQRLILKSGEYGKDGAEYVTEKFSNVKIKSVGRAFNLLQPLDAPGYFEVTFEDGSQAWYGSPDPLSDIARTLVEYNITKWKDAQGNYITYNYVQTDNVAVISSIQWGGNETLVKPHFNEIKFNYNPITRDFKEQSYLSGAQFTQSRLLSSIEVLTGIDVSAAPFKKYEITYKKNRSNYQLVESIKELNSAGEAATPVVFSYPTDNIQNEYLHTDGDMSRATKIYADFNRDGEADYIEYTNTHQIRYKKSVYRASEPVNLSFDTSKLYGSDFYNGIPITFKDSGNIVKNVTGILIPKKINSTLPNKKDYELQFYSVDLVSNQLKYEYSKIIPYSSYHIYDYIDEEDDKGNCFVGETNISRIRNYDYDGDGLDEILISFTRYISCEPEPENPENPARISGRRTINYYADMFVNINSPSFGENDIVVYNAETDQTYYQKKRDIISDYDGDGKADILTIKDDNTTILRNFIKNQNGGYSIAYKSSFAQHLDGLTKHALFGDFNGDGKTDLMIPQADKTSNWFMYLSNGSGFTKFTKNNFIYFSAIYESENAGIDSHPLEEDCFYDTRTYHQYSAEDLDKDGKSEIVVKKMVILNHGWRKHYQWEYTGLSLNVYSNVTGSQPSGDIAFTNTFSKSFIFPQKVIPFSMLTLDKYNRQLVVVGKPDDCENDCNINYVYHFAFPNVQYYSRIKSITQGGITTQIDYKELDPSVNPNLYAPIKTEQYPYMELDKVSKTEVVSHLSQWRDGVQFRKQDFRYRGFITHLQGKGMIGFRQTARSSWYAYGFENTKIWSGAEMDPLNDGVPIKEWSIKTNSENQIFPADLSVNNTQLLSFKQTAYQTDVLSNGVKAIVPVQSTTKDFLKDITTVDTVTYGDYYLPVQTVSNINSGFAVSTTDLSYIHNPSGMGKDYYIGRPASKNEQMAVYGDSKGAKEDYTYENNLLKTKKSWNRNDSGWFLETYDYDGFGNITEKTITNSKDSNSKKDEAQYEPKGRFVDKKTDNLNLETHITYNDWGQVLTQTDPLGVTLTNTYDDWGKLLKSKTNLAGTTTYTYEKSYVGDVIISEYSPDGSITINYTNKIGQKYKTSAKKFGQGEYVSVMTTYDALGRKKGEYEPYLGQGAGASQLNTIEYDDYSRPIKATAFTGKIVETTYSGRTVTATETNANNRFRKQTADALGNITSSEDLGGVINFKYNAAGENTEADYEGNIVKTDYDVWGNKVRFEDPSNGVYEYQYNGYFGTLSKTISPKGEKTYEYNSKGQLIQQKEKTTSGNATDKTINFTYNSKGLVTEKSGTSLGKAYSSGVTYDSYGRALSSYENSNGKYFIKKGISYDDKMRITSYEKQLYSSGILTKVSIENEYEAWSGQLSAVKEKGTGKLLWQLNEVNAKGQVTAAKLGNVNIVNTYAGNGFLNNINHTSAGTGNNTILQIGYSFNAIKNELNTRTTGGDFNIIEQFEYDSNNRLVNWTNPVTGVFTQNQKRNVYDNKGRITQNDEVGTFSFNNTLKKYRPTGMVLNTEGTANYNNDLLQKITYNENNDPVFIDGLKGDVAFEYGLTSMRQVVYYGGNFQQPTTDNQQPNSKFTKYYSEDGSYEIIRNNQTGQEKHLIYIGGTPYEANIVYLKDFTASTPNFVFLHKDYLGSILAITDEAGTKLEQRHFDAWGNLTHLKIGNSAIITDKEQIRDYLSNGNLIVDRGYTSHEHFAEVGLIHMNGRLYDPLLRRFLNADENIQDPHNTQNYNKYGYVLNNPLMFNDPSGEFIGFVFAAIKIASMLFATIQTVSLLAGWVSGQITFGQFIGQVIFNVASSLISYGIGDIFKAGGSVATALGNYTFLAQAGAHAISQGVLGLMQSDNFWSGAAAGFLGSLGASGWGSLSKVIGLGSLSNNGFATIAFGALAGGVGAELGGGNFWQGAVTGGIVAAFNHEMHKMDSPFNQDEVESFAQQTGDPQLSPPDASKLHPRFNTGNKDWQKVSGRWTITTKKEILQWDTLHSEIEVFNKGKKEHLGGFNPKTAKLREGSIRLGRPPHGGWKIDTGKILKTGSKILKGLEKINRSMIIFDFFPTWMIPYQTGTVKYQPEEL